MSISTTVPTACNAQPSARDSGLETRDPRKRGAPKGNKNAARHGLYSHQNHEANMAFLEENTYLKSLSFYSLSAVAERVGVRFGRADREIFLAAWQISEVARRNPSDERLDVMAVKRFLKLVMRKYWGLS